MRTQRTRVNFSRSVGRPSLRGVRSVSLPVTSRGEFQPVTTRAADSSDDDSVLGDIEGFLSSTTLTSAEKAQDDEYPGSLWGG